MAGCKVNPMIATSKAAKELKEQEAEEAYRRFQNYAQKSEDQALGNSPTPVSDGTEDGVV